MIKKVYFFNEETAKKAVVRNDTAMISISDDKDVELPDWGNRVLRLQFHDIDQRHLDKYPGLVVEYNVFNEDQAKQIVDFLNKLDNQVDTIYVHCSAGVSRSAGVAFFIAEKYDVPINKQSVEYFGKNYRIYNKLVYSTLRKADECLKNLK